MVTMTLRLDDQTAEALRVMAENEHRSKNDVVLLAIRDRAVSSMRREQRSATIGRLIADNRELLDRLAR